MNKQMLCASAALLAPSIAFGQVTYGTDDVTIDENYSLDIGSGVSTGPVWTGSESWGIADDEANSLYYVNDGANLSSAPFNSMGGPVTSVGTIVEAGSGSTYTMTGLAFDNGTLYGHRNIATEALYTIDLVTLDATAVLVYSSTSIDLGGLDIDPATGLVLGSNDSSSYTDPGGVVGRGIIALDAGAGPEANLYPYPIDPTTGSELTDGDGLAFDPTGSGSVYVIEDEPAPLHRYDIGMGAYDPMPATNAVAASEVFSAGTYTGAGGSGTIGTNYCTAVANSTGVAASISASGSTSAAANDLTLAAADMPAQQFGIFVTSQTQASTPVASGILCVGGTIIRFQQILQADANGSFSQQIDTQALPAGVPTPIMAGETWNFTAWFRDVDPMMGNTANFSDGVSILFN